ncbi:type II secretion system F family protein [Desertihabitans aurantiacus]|uniref:type II secretion system F family protein n=1 Tax=Desertihabitans aurantiacus TaxID=2282477 RepID=UPI000DF82849|nr:type II secretion system F family protein [Desertihabitans aurantiacus]
MFTFSTLWPALGACGAFVVFLLGYRMVRARPSDYLDASDLVLLRDERRRESRRSLLDRLSGALVPALRQLIGGATVRYLQRQIDHAGRPSGVSVDSLLRRVVLWALLMLPVTIIFLAAEQWLALLLVPVVVVVLPLMPVASQARRRRESIDRDLPDFLDVLAVTVTAGIAFRAALARVTDRFSGPISDEVRLTLDQLSHGASIRVAFAGMEQRSGSAAMKTFVTAFLQAEELGAPLVETLNQIARDMRRASAQAARRRAAQTAPRVTLVTSLVLVPATLLLILVGIVLGAEIDLGALLETFG